MANTEQTKPFTPKHLVIGLLVLLLGILLHTWGMEIAERDIGPNITEYRGTVQSVTSKRVKSGKNGHKTVYDTNVALRKGSIYTASTSDDPIVGYTTVRLSSKHSIGTIIAVYGYQGTYKTSRSAFYSQTPLVMFSVCLMLGGFFCAVCSMPMKDKPRKPAYSPPSISTYNHRVLRR